MDNEVIGNLQSIVDMTCIETYKNGEVMTSDSCHINGAEEDDGNNKIDEYCNSDLSFIDLQEMMITSPGYPNLENSSEADRMQYMEEQQEMLNSCLIALTTHFAQVQLRLRQIVEAPPNEKEALLKDLEEFAFRGIPELNCNISKKKILNDVMEDREEKINVQRNKQKELIEQLKSQLEDLEKYAYETGEAGLPQNLVIERQRIVLDQLKGKLNLNIEHIDKLTVEDLRAHVDNAIGQLVNPMKMKDQLVTQLKTQISDLERFIDFLQGTSGESYTKEVKECTCKCPAHAVNHNIFKKNSTNMEANRRDSRERRGEEITAKTISIMKRVAALLQIFVGSQFECEEKERFSRNSLKKSMKINHWGDLRAHLELAVAEVIELAQEPEPPIDSDYMSDSESVTTVQCNGKLATAVRKHLAMCIQNLMEHGLMPIGQSSSLVPFIACFPVREPSNKNEMHAWELILRFYEMKNGEQFNSTPARKLSQSFNLDILGSSSLSYKQSLLGVVGNIITTHSQYKRGYDSYFKAFVCAGLNCKMLVPWLRLIFRCQPLLEMYYQSWSYVVKTGFEDSFISLDKLNQFHFDLPVDLAIRQLQNIKDAF